MALRLGGLADIDPGTVPLPPGTEVVLVAAIDAVDAAWPSSVLPPEPPVAAVDAADAWLREIRRTAW